MHTFNDHVGIDDLRYEGTAQKHYATIERQVSDPNTVLGALMSQGRTVDFPPPPSNSSSETIIDLNLVVDRQATATLQDRDYAVRMDDLRQHYEMWNTEVKQITGTEYGYDFFWSLATKGDGFLQTLKIKFRRLRPYQLARHHNKRVEMLIKEPGTGSYPSGHAFDAWLFAFVLSTKHPKHSEEFAAIAKRVCDSRMVAGVHFPHDLRMGKVAALMAIHIMQGSGIL